MTIEHRIRQYQPKKENLLNILHEIQNHHPQQYLSTKDLKVVASYLNISLSAVYGVVTYYSMFSLKPRGKYLIRICRSPVCCIKDAFDLIEVLKQLLGVELGETTSDGLFTLETSECLGKCEMAPSMSINDTHFGGLSKARLKTILNKIKGKTSD
jgi:NADH-quinone oxidoreductase subunit E